MIGEFCMTRKPEYFPTNYQNIGLNETFQAQRIEFDLY